MAQLWLNKWINIPHLQIVVRGKCAFLFPALPHFYYVYIRYNTQGKRHDGMYIYVVHIRSYVYMFAYSIWFYLYDCTLYVYARAASIEIIIKLHASLESARRNTNASVSQRRMFPCNPRDALRGRGWYWRKLSTIVRFSRLLFFPIFLRCWPYAACHRGKLENANARSLGKPTKHQLEIARRAQLFAGPRILTGWNNLTFPMGTPLPFEKPVISSCTNDSLWILSRTASGQDKYYALSRIYIV